EICGLALLGIGLVLAIAGICLLLAAPTYQAVARMKIERDSPAQFSSNDGRGFSLTTYDPYFIQTEFEVLQSDFVLSRVVTDLKLDQEWGKRHADGKPLKMEQAVAMLRARLQLRPVRNTSLVEICVSSDKPSEAAQIANAIAGGYRMHRLERRRQTSLGGVELL